MGKCRTGSKRTAANGISALMLLAFSVPLAASGFAYGVNGEDFSLSRYQIDAEGRLRHLGHTPIDKAPSDVAIDPSGQFVVAVSNTTDRLMVFRLDAFSGEVQPVPGSPFATGARSPFSIRFHPSGRFIYAGVRFGGVGAFSFDPKTGFIKPLPDSPFPAQRRTREVTIHPFGNFLYASNGLSNSVSAYRINQQTGGLKELSGSPYSVGDFGEIDYLSQKMLDVPPEAGGMPHSIDMDPQGHFVFVANKGAGSASVFGVDEASGELKLVAGSPFFVGFNPYRSRVHPSGRFVLTTLWADGKVAVHALDRNSGRLTEVDGSPFALDSQTPVDLKFSADGRQVYVSNFDGNEITLLDMDVVSGKLRLQESLTTRLSPWSLALVPAKPLKQSSKQPSKQSVQKTAQQILFATGGTVGLAHLNETKTEFADSLKGHGDALAVAPSGRFAYALDMNNASITSYAVDHAQGAMTPVPNGIVKTGVKPTDMTIDVNGWYLYVTNSGDASLSVYYLNPTNGIPEPVRGSPAPAGKRPVAVTLDAAARYAFVVNADSNNVSVYRYFTSVTPLIFEGKKYGSPFAAGKEPLALAMEPTGHYAYVANAGSNDISAYHVHHKTGVMAAIPGSPFKAGQRPVDLKVHPEGRWLYVANQNSSTLTVHRIEAGLGALANKVKTVALPAKPGTLKLNAEGDQLYVLVDRGHRLLRYMLDASTGDLKLASDQYFPQALNDLVVVNQAMLAQ